MKKIINKLGILEKIEIVSAIVYLSTWLLFSLFVGIGIAAAILCLLTLINKMNVSKRLSSKV